MQNESVRAPLAGCTPLPVAPNFTRTSYETILAMLRRDITVEQRERLAAELRSRDRAMHNQWVEICGGQFK